MAQEENYRPDQVQVNLNCRYYPQKYPLIDELVVVQVKSVQDIGVYVQLLQYNRIQGMVMLSEFSRKRVRTVSKLTRVGRKEVVMVIRVDEAKGYIDLSKKRVTEDEIVQCQNKYNKAKAVHSILRNVAVNCQINIKDLYKKIGWPLYQKYENALDGLRIAATDPDTVFEGLDMTAEIREALMHGISVKLAPKPVKIRADFSITCYEYEGINAIKEALRAGLALSKENIEIMIKLISSPNYVMIVKTTDKNGGMEMASASLKKISGEIKKSGGNFIVKEQPYFINDQGDQDVEELILKQTLMNKNTSDMEEDMEEGMDVDIGIDVRLLDARAAQLAEQDSDEEEKS